MMEMGVVEGTARECMGDPRARGGWVFTTGEHHVVECSCVGSDVGVIYTKMKKIDSR